MVARSDVDRVPASSASLAVYPPVPYAGAAPRDTLGSVSTASRRLRALAALSGSLTDPLTAEEAADLVERQALAVLGASSAVVVTLAQGLPNVSADASANAQPLAPTSGRSTEALTLVHAIGGQERGWTRKHVHRLIAVALHARRDSDCNSCRRLLSALPNGAPRVSVCTL